MGASETSVSTAGLQSPSQHCQWRLSGEGGGACIPPHALGRREEEEKEERGKQRTKEEIQGGTVRRSLIELQCDYKRERKTKKTRAEEESVRVGWYWESSK